MKKTQVVDLFCWIWWLSHWFVKEGFDIIAWIDIEDSCKFAFEENNHAKFISKDIREVTPDEINKLYDTDTKIRILVWCAPCQPFSLMNTKKGKYTEKEINKKSPLDSFSKLISETQPDIVSMENVPWIAKAWKHKSFGRFIENLKSNWYLIWQNWIIDCTRYGIPQTRKRFVLIAAKEHIWKIHIHEKYLVEKPKTVRETIWNLEKIKHWKSSLIDKYHKARSLSKKNLERIKLVKKDWWSLQDIPSKYRPDCYQKKSWKSYVNNVYGRMKRDAPAPTMTTFCTGYGNGRFGHPDQDRAISLREAARIQTFPDTYLFSPEWEKVAAIKIAKQIWNAVPVRLWEIIAGSIKDFIY